MIRAADTDAKVVNVERRGIDVSASVPTHTPCSFGPTEICRVAASPRVVSSSEPRITT